MFISILCYVRWGSLTSKLGFSSGVILEFLRHSIAAWSLLFWSVSASMTSSSSSDSCMSKAIDCISKFTSTALLRLSDLSCSPYLKLFMQDVHFMVQAGEMGTKSFLAAAHLSINLEAFLGTFKFPLRFFPPFVCCSPRPVSVLALCSGCTITK